MRQRATRMSGNAHGPLKPLAALIAAMFVATSAPAFDWSAWDLSTQYQDSGGTLPVTTVEQPVGLILDRSKGGAKRGADVVLNGGFNDSSAWTSPAPAAVIGNGVLTVTAAAAGTQLIVQAGRVVVGKIYEVTYDVLTSSGGAISVGTTAAAGNAGAGVGRFRDVFVAASTTLAIFARNSATTATVDNVQVREITGPNLWQGTSTIKDANWTDNGDGSFTSNGSSGLLGWNAASPKLIIGRTYEVIIRVIARTAGQVTPPYDGAGANNTNAVATVGTFRRIFTAIAASLYIYSTNFNGTVDSIYIAEIPGNHLIQPTPPSRPILTARVNALNASQDWSNASWVKTSGGGVAASIEVGVPAPDGSATTNRLSVIATGNASVTQAVTSPGASGIYSIYTKKGNLTTAVFVLRNSTTSTNFAFGTFNYDTGSISAGWTVETLANGWFRLSYAYTGVSAGDLLVAYSGFTGNPYNAGDYTLVWGAQLIATWAGTTRYQRVTSAADYDTVGFAKGWRFDGTDDGLYTPAVFDWTATDKVTVVGAVRKLSDASLATIAELGPATASTNGSWLLCAPSGTNSTTFGMFARGTAYGGVSPAGFPAPYQGTVIATTDIAAARLTLAVDGGSGLSVPYALGAGNFASQVLYVGRRSNSTLPFPGVIFSLRGFGRLVSPDERGWLLSQAKLDMNNNL